MHPKQFRKFLVFMVKESLLTAKSEIGVQIFSLTICYWEMNPDQDAHQTSTKTL